MTNDTAAVYTLRPKAAMLYLSFDSTLLVVTRKCLTSWGLNRE